jgi:integrase
VRSRSSSHQQAWSSTAPYVESSPKTSRPACWKPRGRCSAATTCHHLRHYFASVQIRGGQSIKVLQALLGHKSAVETWDTYGHLMRDEDTRSRAIVDKLLGGDQMPQSARRSDQSPGRRLSWA